MADIPELRYLIQSEETKADAATSEATFTRVGATTNFINKRQYDSKLWAANGRYSQKSGVVLTIDGAYPVWQDMQIVGLHVYNHTAGSSGLTQFDIYKQSTSGGARTSLFTVRPSLSYTSGNYAYLIYDAVLGSPLINPTGAVQPTFTGGGLLLTRGEQLTCDMTSTQVGGYNAGIELLMRPR
jgi:hypothetical protein